MRRGQRRAVGVAAGLALLLVGAAGWWTWRVRKLEASGSAAAGVADPGAGAGVAGAAAPAGPRAAAETPARVADDGAPPDGAESLGDVGPSTEGAETGEERRRGGIALGADGRGGGPRAIYLEAPPPAPGAVSTRVGGLDTGAPRALVLWRLEDGERVRVAEGFSTPDGALHFPGVVVPRRALELVVTAAEPAAHGLDASAPARVERGAPRPPRLVVQRADASGVTVRVAASESGGAVLLAGGDGVVLERVPLPRVPDPARRVFDVELPLGPGEAVVLAAHELPGGERSSWSVHSLAPPAGGAPAAGP